MILLDNFLDKHTAFISDINLIFLFEVIQVSCRQFFCVAS